MNKNNIFKIFVLTLCAFSLISFSACGNNEKDDDYISSDIYETDDLISDDVTGETEGTELEEDVFETEDAESDKGGITANSSNSGTGESSKANDSSSTTSKDTSLKDTSSTESKNDESETSSETKLEVTEDGTIKLPPVKLY